MRVLWAVSAKVWARRNMSSTPSPRARKGKTWVVEALKGSPSTAHNPRPAATVTVTSSTPAKPKPAAERTESDKRAREKHAYNTFNTNTTTSD